MVRFGFGILCGFAVLFVASLFVGGTHDDGCCPMIAVGFWTLVCCSLLRFTLFIRQHTAMQTMRERHSYISIASGVGYVAMLALFFFVAIENASGRIMGWLIVLFFVGYPSACTWIIFRPVKV